MLFEEKGEPYAHSRLFQLESSQFGEVEKETTEVPPTKVKTLEGHNKEVISVMGFDL